MRAKLPLQKSSFSSAMAPEKLADGAVMMMLESLIAFVDEVKQPASWKPQEKV
jgi:hypothetical protein